MTRFVDHRFTKLYRATIGVDFLAKEVTIDKRSVILQVRYIYIHLGLLNPQDLKHKRKPFTSCHTGSTDAFITKQKGLN